MTISTETFINAYQRALDEEEAAMFVCAGLSVPAGFVGWKDLLRDIAEELDLNIDDETDLIAIAQYHVNQTGGRDGINRKLMEEYTKDATPSDNHRLMASLPISTIWTTNYDHLLEDALKHVRKRVDRKVSQEDLARTLPKRDVVVYKMHGDIDRPHEAVLTKRDYERYDDSRKLFSVQLRGDLVSKTFLFLGFSFTDPNVGYILARVRNLVGENRRDHYWLTRDAAAGSSPDPVEIRRQKHRIADLKTYGIQTILVQDYSEITALLKELNDRVNRKNVFFSGSAVDFSPLGEVRVTSLLREIGREIIGNGFNLVCGMGANVGDAVAMGAIEAVYRKEGAHLDERTILRPFPQRIGDAQGRAVLWTRYREEMLQRVRIAIFALGNKKDATGAVTAADGMSEEFEIAKRLRIFPIPIAATGHVAARLSQEVLARLDEFYDKHATAARPHLELLANAAATDAEILKSITSLLKLIAPK